MLLLGSKDDTESNIKVVGRLRRPQIITTFGNGAIVDLPNYSVVMAAADYWKKQSPVLHEPNLERLLSVKEFRQPYIYESDDNIPTPDIPAFRFPFWHFCSECGRLMPFWGFGSHNDRKCLHCKRDIIPSRFVATCINGHLEDFPYNWWVHYEKGKECPGYGKSDNLKIEFLNNSGGLESIKITCSLCGASRTMEGSLGKDSLKGYSCKRKRLWIGNRKEHNDPHECKAKMWALQRGASNLYFSVTESALTIPPWSNKIHSAINEAFDRLSVFWASKPDENSKKVILSHEFHNLVSSGYTIEQIETEINRRFDYKSSDSFDRKDIYSEEYMALCGADQNEYQFKITHSTVPELLTSFFTDIVLVNRLREVLVLKGFRRISPDIPSSGNELFNGYNFDLEKDCISLFKDDQSWLPAIELLGEGIFINVNINLLEKWSIIYKSRFETLYRRLAGNNVVCENMSPEYILLHTLSHLLIRQLSLECGYSSASIKERIYCTFPDSIKMSGILLYTSSSDSDGSLGGLVRQGLPDAFEQTFMNMLNDAMWCSSDPVCIESDSQGYDSLNMAACHACALLPETCCEKRNSLLDRVALIGKLNERNLGFFRDIIYD